MIKYWHRIKTDTPDTPLKFYPIWKKKENLGEHNWLSTVKFLHDYSVI